MKKKSSSVKRKNLKNSIFSPQIRNKKINTKKTQSDSRDYRFKVFESFCKTKKINTKLEKTKML